MSSINKKGQSNNKKGQSNGGMDAVMTDKEMKEYLQQKVNRLQYENNRLCEENQKLGVMIREGRGVINDLLNKNEGAGGEAAEAWLQQTEFAGPRDDSFMKGQNNEAGIPPAEPEKLDAETDLLS